MCRGTLNAGELKAEAANLEVIKSKMSTFHIMRTILNAGQGVLPTENAPQLRKLLLFHVRTTCCRLLWIRSFT